MVIIYFGGFALMWSVLAAMLAAREGRQLADAASGAGPPVLLLVALALHAAIVAITAWKAHRFLFGHGLGAVAICALPLLELMHRLWFIPALLYAIATAYAWMASSRETVGQLQASPRR